MIMCDTRVEGILEGIFLHDVIYECSLFFTIHRPLITRIYLPSYVNDKICVYKYITDVIS